MKCLLEESAGDWRETGPVEAIKENGCLPQWNAFHNSIDTILNPNHIGTFTCFCMLRMNRVVRCLGASLTGLKAVTYTPRPLCWGLNRSFPCCFSPFSTRAEEGAETETKPKSKFSKLPAFTKESVKTLSTDDIYNYLKASRHQRGDVGKCIGAFGYNQIYPLVHELAGRPDLSSSVFHCFESIPL